MKKLIGIALLSVIGLSSHLYAMEAAQVRINLADGEIALDEAQFQELKSVVAENIRDFIEVGGKISLPNITLNGLALLIEILPKLHNRKTFAEHLEPLFNQNKYAEYRALLVNADYLGIESLLELALTINNLNLNYWALEKPKHLIALLELQKDHPQVTFIDVNYQPPHPKWERPTALIQASKTGGRELVQALIEAGADVNARDLSGSQFDETALIYAAKEGHNEVIKLLLTADADADIQDRNKKTALIWALENGHPDSATLLIEAGANVNAKVWDDTTPLIWASKMGSDPFPLDQDKVKAYVDVVRLLIDKEAEIDSKDDMGVTALSYAAFKGHKEIATMLIKAGADVNSQDDNKLTPLFRASQSGNEDIIDLLLEAGASIDLSKAALNWAALKGHKDVVAKLIKAGADLNFIDRNRTPLDEAIRFGHKDIYDVLIDKGALLDKGKALRRATLYGKEDIVKDLLDKKAPVDEQDSEGDTALILASQRVAPGGDDINIVTLLLEAKADRTIENKAGKTAYDVARNDTVKQMLRR